MAIEDVPYNLTPQQVIELWDGYAAGQTVSQLARRFGKKQPPMYRRIQASGGIRPTIPKRAGRHLTLDDRSLLPERSQPACAPSERRCEVASTVRLRTERRPIPPRTPSA
jgi:hypothetical protein